MKKYATDQEKYWAGSFGDNYNIRNKNLKYIADNIALFSRILSHAQGVNSIKEMLKSS